jgi:predicted transcriptional regulator
VKASFEEVSKNLQTLSGDTLMRIYDFLSDEFWLKQERYYQLANQVLNELEKRIDPNTYFVTGMELTAPDLDAMRMELEQTLQHDEKVAQIRKKRNCALRKVN